MAILITGSKGFIGSRTVTLLKENGYDAVCFEGDIMDRNQVLGFEPEKKIDSFIHLAGVINKKDAELFRRTNIEGTKNIVDFCIKNKVRLLVFLSSLKVLSGLDNPYIRSKKEAEKIIIASGLPYIILRPSMVYGPGDKKNIGFLFKLAKKLPFLPRFKFRIQLLFVDDLVKIVISSLNLMPNQIINIAGRTTSYMDLLIAAKEFGYKFSIINWPKFFSLILKTASHLPFFPMPAWQIDSLLADEIFEEYQWRQLFNIKETSFIEGISKTFTYEVANSDSKS